jgi:peptidoglycan/xylan/chitin deacetylase (PgdA/CDA1 family)
MGISGGIKSTLHALGAYRHRLAVQPYPGVAVLAYHAVRASAATPMHGANLHVTAARLDEHCRALRALDCAPLSLDEWAAVASGRRAAPPRAVMITFDDGYRSVLTDALPVLERHGIPATVFVCTGAVGRQVRFWFDAVAAAEGEEAVERAKALAYGEWRDLAARAERPVGAGDPHAPLTVDELRQLAAHPLIAIGAHTVTHPILAKAPAAVQRDEIAGSCAALRTWIGTAPAAFAYPNGRRGIDYTVDTVRMLGDCGIAHAFRVGDAFAVPRESPLEVPRFLMVDAVSGVELAHRLALAWPRPAGAIA